MSPIAVLTPSRWSQDLQLAVVHLAVACRACHKLRVFDPVVPLQHLERDL